MGTRQRNLRIDDDLWDAFGAAVERASPEFDRSTVIRQLVRWYACEPGAKLPERPEPKDPAR